MIPCCRFVSGHISSSFHHSALKPALRVPSSEVMAVSAQAQSCTSLQG